MQKNKTKKILIATGGTGGHLFPAQALAFELGRENPEYEILLAGNGLSSNRYLHGSFSYKQISSATFFGQRRALKNFKSFWMLGKGCLESLRFLKEFQPDLIIGFGSFHTFPILFIAQLRNIPFILFEPNVIPGKVNRFFAKKALVTAIQFKQTKPLLSGNSVVINMPLWSKVVSSGQLSPSEAKQHYGLDPDRLTILIFGGSQGAKSLNALTKKSFLKIPYQILHFTGDPKTCSEVTEKYQRLGLKFCVKPFEEKMEIAWKAADIAICRSGASTIAEMIEYEVPALLIPFPLAAENHQKINAELIQEEVKGGLFITEPIASLELFQKTLDTVISQREEMKRNIQTFKKNCNYLNFTTLIKNSFPEIKTENLVI